MVYTAAQRLLVIESVNATDPLAAGTIAYHLMPVRAYEVK